MSLRILASAVLLAALALAPLAVTGKPAASQAGRPLAAKLDRSRAGTLAPPVKFTTRDGDAATVANFRGKPVLVNLWATWCAPCIAELPDLDELAENRRASLTVLTISQDLGGWRAIDKFWTTGKFERIVPRLDAQGNYAQAVGAAGLPVSILYDAKGREVWRINGPVKWTSAEAAAALR
ncbi:TlpA family protein disulfide reductase [Glacieibacterium frigidum]|uniref:TlpA family protein disulfide reductase n=1 Tax=Glacieibacterium frigidum TaxID=2593303 RepID=UPI00163D7C25|nr:TlpA disulfide reductase family protein [Glacieibacterium frigidum]